MRKRTYIRRSYNCRCGCGQRLVFKDYGNDTVRFDIEQTNKTKNGFKTRGSVSLTYKQLLRILGDVLK